MQPAIGESRLTLLYLTQLEEIKYLILFQNINIISVPLLMKKRFILKKMISIASVLAFADEYKMDRRNAVARFLVLT